LGSKKENKKVFIISLLRLLKTSPIHWNHHQGDSAAFAGIGEVEMGWKKLSNPKFSSYKNSTFL
jgi:hypothetical protein